VQISERNEGRIVVITVAGRLDHAGAESFQEYALRRINEGARSILVDFRGTTFIASMGIRALIVPTQEISKKGGRLALTGLSPQLHELFELAGLLKVFQVYSTAAEASADGVWP
jgi:anti-sigma B factor antagonist